ncbi:hypothetical protein DVS28_a5080 [Euzebya pacifica]|uniref:Uncharacterized protein n=1 Tax=Euzebya pacifica TaxID=1608957 RepID=A0A346Y5I9_9ACTN|nr:hypothetical protein DVS28_a5080 [Euzebya pacifica]
MGRAGRRARRRDRGEGGLHVRRAGRQRARAAGVLQRCRRDRPGPWVVRRPRGLSPGVDGVSAADSAAVGAGDDAVVVGRRVPLGDRRAGRGGQRAVGVVARPARGRAPRLAVAGVAGGVAGHPDQLGPGAGGAAPVGGRAAPVGAGRGCLHPRGAGRPGQALPLRPRAVGRVVGVVAWTAGRGDPGRRRGAGRGHGGDGAGHRMGRAGGLGVRPPEHRAGRGLGHGLVRRERRAGPGRIGSGAGGGDQRAGRRRDAGGLGRRAVEGTVGAAVGAVATGPPPPGLVRPGRQGLLAPVQPLAPPADGPARYGSCRSSGGGDAGPDRANRRADGAGRAGRADVAGGGIRGGRCSRPPDPLPVPRRVAGVHPLPALRGVRRGAGRAGAGAGRGADDIDPGLPAGSARVHPCVAFDSSAEPTSPGSAGRECCSCWPSCWCPVPTVAPDASTCPGPGQPEPPSSCSAPCSAWPPSSRSAGSWCRSPHPSRAASSSTGGPTASFATPSTPPSS